MSDQNQVDDRGEPARIGGVPVAPVVLGGLALLFLAVILGGAALYFFGGQGASQEAEKAQADAAQRAANARLAGPRPERPAPMLRRFFQEKVLGKTPDEVIEAVGKPDSILEADDSTWCYDRRTMDPLARGADLQARVVFVGGVVKRVEFH